MPTVLLEVRPAKGGGLPEDTDEWGVSQSQSRSQSRSQSAGRAEAPRGAGSGGGCDLPRAQVGSIQCALLVHKCLMHIGHAQCNNSTRVVQPRLCWDCCFAVGATRAGVPGSCESLRLLPSIAAAALH